MTALVCPYDSGRLKFPVEGGLRCPICEKSYVIRDGIPRFVQDVDDLRQEQVQKGFAYKWMRDTWGFKPKHIDLMRAFFWTRFGFSSEEDVRRFFEGKRVLHAGIGSGQTEQYYLSHCEEVWGIDISESVDACHRNWDEYYPNLSPRLHLAQADLMAMPFQDGEFDIVVSDGVLHHTPDTFRALAAITTKVRVGGSVLFYVYKKKGPIREFVDDHVREMISDLPPDEAWCILEPLTALAKELSHQQIKMNVPCDVGLLGFESGTYDLQRWLYWNVMKFYWNDALNFDENNHVNFDWYYPKYAWRHEPETVRGWLAQLGLRASRFYVGDSGISVVAVRSRNGHP